MCLKPLRTHNLRLGQVSHGSSTTTGLAHCDMRAVPPGTCMVRGTSVAALLPIADRSFFGTANCAANSLPPFQPFMILSELIVVQPRVVQTAFSKLSIPPKTCRRVDPQMSNAANVKPPARQSFLHLQPVSAMQATMAAAGTDRSRQCRRRLNEASPRRESTTSGKSNLTPAL